MSSTRPDLGQVARLHDQIRRRIDSDLRGEVPVIVVNGDGPTGLVFTDRRVIVYTRDEIFSWRIEDVQSATWSLGSKRLVVKAQNGAASIKTFAGADVAAQVAVAVINRQVLEQTRPRVLIRAYGKPDPDPSDRQKALPYVKELPSNIIASANKDAVELAELGYYPVAMAWYDAGSQASSIMAYNNKVTEVQLVLTITYRLDDESLVTPVAPAEQPHSAEKPQGQARYVPRAPTWSDE